MPPEMNSAAYWHMTYGRYFRADDLWTVYLERLLPWDACLDLIPIMANNLLDVGCGAGGFLGFASRQRAGPELYGCDFAESAIAMARAAVPQATFYTAPALTLPFASNSFDVVYSGHLIEHVDRPGAVLLEQARVVKPGGLVIVHFPYDDEPYGEHRHHNLTYDIVGRWMEHAGLTVEGELEPVEGNPPKRDGIIYGSK